MSEIVTTANTDAPANYYQSRHSGEEIDNAVDMMGGGTSPANGLASLGAKSRLNLLKNPYFTENSRGQEKYTAAGYTVDGWRLNAATGTVTVLPHGIRFASTSTAQLSQWIAAAYDDLANHTLTVSGYIDNVLYTATATIPSAKPTAYTTFARVDIADNCFLAFSWSSSSQKFEVRINFSAAGSVFIAAAKLEFGDKSTLAYPSVVKAPNLAGSLLENGDFALNSLGKVEYVGAVDSVDNWFSTNSNLTVQVAEDGVHLTCKDGGNGYFRQFISKLPVGTYTISALVKGTGSMFMCLTTKDYDSIFSGIVSTQLTDDWAIAQYTYNVTNDYNIECAYMRVNPGGTVDIQAIKLEKKSASTLEPLVDKTIWTLVDQSDRPVEALRSACYYDGEWQGLIRGIGAKPGDNILINPLFKINQRGDSSYSSKIGGTVDAWKTSNTNTTVKVTAHGVTISASSGSTPYLVQVLDDDKSTALLGKTVSLSVLNQDGHLHSISQVLPEKATNVNQVCCYIPGQCDLLVMSTGAIWVRLMASAGGTNSFSATKLELGPTQTLARQMEDGTWELLEQEDPLELLKCQRYFRRIHGINSFFATGYFTSQTLAYLFVPLQVPIRINVPTITLSGTVYMWTPDHVSGNAIQSTEIQANSVGENRSLLYLSFVVSNATKGAPCAVQFRDNAGYIDISAEL